MQHSLVLDGEDVSLVLDYGRLLLVEERLGRGIMAIGAELARGDMLMRSMAELIAVCALPRQDIHGLGERLMRCGISRVSEVVAGFICDVLAGELITEGKNSLDVGDELAVMMMQFPDC